MKSIIDRIFSIKTLLSLLLVFAASGAWADVPTPAAVWDGNFSTTKVNGWTLNANGNTVASDKSTITITSKGFTITPSTAVAPGTGVTVLVKMSGLSQNANNDQILVCAKQGSENVMTGTSLCAGAMTLHGAWWGSAKWDNANNAETAFSVPSSGEFYILFANGNANGYVREGVYANGTINTKEISGLRASGSGYDVGMITIGGRPASESERASNAVISRVMIYEGNLTQQQMKDAIDDMETTKSYSLQCQGSGNKGGLNWANFQLPYLTHYVESGSASLNTDKALRQITIPWRPDGTVNGSGATSIYLGITDSSGKLLALSSGADMSTVTTTSSSTFDFSQAYLSAGTQYRYWFLNSDSYSLGDTITAGIQMGCALYYLGSNVSQMQSNTMGAYCPAARFWCSNMTGSEFTATAGGTAVATSGAYADDITLKGVADGKFTLGGALNAARITLADAAATIEMDSGDSIKAQYLDNSTQKLVIDASNGATAVGTYTLFEGNLASVADANLEVTFPSLGSGYELYTTKTANKISYQVDRTAVNATLTLTANCSFSEVKGSLDWMDSHHSTLEIVNNQESPITLIFDEDITAGSITVSGTGTTIIESSNSAVITAGTVTVPSGSTFDATGASITTCAGAGTFIWTAGYPATVPAGATYKYVGGATAEASVTIPAVAVNGTLKTSGHILITNPSITAGCSLEVLDGNTTIGTGGSTCQLKGNIKVDAGATLTNTKTDTLDYNGNMTVDIYGTLAMGTSRWSITGGTTRFNLYAGSAVTGAGDGAAGLDFIGNRAMDLYGTDGGGTVTVEGPVRIRNSATRIWIAEDMTLDFAGGLHDTGHTAGFSQVGPGTLKIGAHSDVLGATSTMTQGKLVLNNTTVVVPVTLEAQASLEVVATEEATTVPVNVTTKSDNVTFSGAGKVNGTITKTSAPSGNLATALQSSAWTGTFVADWAGANGTQFDINSYGNANSVVEVTKLAGGYVSGSNANVTVVPTVKVSGTMTLDNGYSGKVTTFTKLTGSGTVTFNTYTCDITTLDNFTGTLTPTDSYGTTIGTINLTSTPVFGAKVVTLGTSANIRSIGSTSVSVNNVADSTIKLAVVANDGIYRAEAAYGGANYKTLAEAVTAAETASADPSAVTVYNSAATIPSGYALVTAAGGAMTLRSAGNGELVYWASGNSGDWSGENSNGTHTFYTTEGGTSTTPYVDGDTVVIANDVQIWSKTAAHGANFQIGTDSVTATVSFSRSGEDCDEYILDGSEVEVKAGSFLVIERYAANTWDSYTATDCPLYSGIRATTITGEGSVKFNTNVAGKLLANNTDATSISCPIELASGATLEVPSTCSVSAPTTSVEDKDVVVSVDLFTKTYSVVDDDAVTAAIIDTDGGAHKFEVAQNAFDYIDLFDYDYFAIYEGEGVEISIDPTKYSWSLLGRNVRIKCLNESSVDVTLDSAEYEFDESEPEGGIVTYTQTNKATDYYWVGATSDAEESLNAKIWDRKQNWKVGSSSGAAASRYPSSVDTAVLEEGAYITTGIVVSDSLTITGSGTLTSNAAIDLSAAGASITVDGVTLDPTPTTSVADYVVRTTGGGDVPTVYTAVLGAAKIGSTPYATLGDALAVEGTVTITLLQNYDGDVTLRLGQTLNSNGKTISGTVSANETGVEVVEFMGIYQCVDNRTNSWTAPSGGYWSIGTSWEKGIEPGANTDVTISVFTPVEGDPTTTGSITLTGNVSAKSITLGAGVVLTLNKSGESAVTLTTTSAIVLSSGQSITTGSGVTLSPTPVSGEDLMYVKTTNSEGATTYALQVAGEMDGTTAKIDDATAEVTVPASATSIETVPVATIKLADGSAITESDVTVKYGDHDITTAFTKTVSAGVVSLSLNPSGYYQNGVGEANQIKVIPEVSASAPMTLGDSAEFTIKTIPGLYYAVQTGTFDGNGDWVSGGSSAAGDAVQATSSSTSVDAPELDENDVVKYYKISVGLTAEEAKQ